MSPVMYKTRGLIAATLACGALAVAAPAVATAAPLDPHPVGGTKDPGYDKPGKGAPKKDKPGSPAAPKPEATQQCNSVTQSGGQESRTTAHKLGRTGPTSFRLSYDTVNIPDTIEVFYQGRRIYNTGSVGEERTVTVNVPRGTADEVVVRVSAPESGTAWSYTVYCPA